MPHQEERHHCQAVAEMVSSSVCFECLQESWQGAVPRYVNMPELALGFTVDDFVKT